VKQLLPLKLINESNKVETLVNQVIGGVAKGTLAPGDRLPNERDVARITGVSRATVREAFSALQILGVIVRKTGKGSYIAAFRDPTKLAERTSALLSQDPYEIWLAREVFEPALSEMIVRGATEDHLAMVECALLSLKKAVEKERWEEYFEADHRFHSALVKCAKNKRVTEVMEQLLEGMDNVLFQAVKRFYFLSDKRNIVRSVRAHEQLYRALLRRDVEEYKVAIHEHFKDLKETIEYYE